MGRLLSATIACALSTGCSGGEPSAAPDAAPLPIRTPADPEISARTSPLGTVLLLAERLESKRNRALAIAEAGAIAARAGQSEWAAEKFDRANAAHVEPLTTAELAVRCVRAGLHEKGVELAAGIKDDGIRAEALERVVRELVAAGQLDRAEDAANRLTAERWIRALTAVAEGYAAAGRKTEAAGALRKALEVRQAQGEEILSPPDTAELARVCAILWGGETPADLFDAAFDRVKRKVRGNPAAELQRSAARVEIIGKYAAAGEFRKALKQADKTKVDQRAVQALVSIAIAFREQGRMKQGFDVLGEAIKRAWKMRPSCAKVAAIKDIAVGYERIGATDKVSGTADQALTVLRKVRGLEKQLCRNTDEVLQALAGAGACDAIWRRLDLVEEVQHQIDTLIDTGARCIDAQRTADAVRMLIRADELVTAHGMGENAAQWAAIARHLSRVGEYEKALAVAAKIEPTSGYKANALAWILLGYLNNIGGESGSAEEQALLEKVWAQLPD